MTKWIHSCIPKGLLFSFRWLLFILINTWHLWERSIYNFPMLEKLNMNKFNKWLPPSQLFIVLFLTNASKYNKRKKHYNRNSVKLHIIGSLNFFDVSKEKKTMKINSPTHSSFQFKSDEQTKLTVENTDIN